jgi:head-tail adaptor
MSLTARLRHRLVILRAVPGAEDAHGAPQLTWTAVATTRGWVQPRRARELAQLSQGGPVTSDHVVFLLPTDVRAADVLRFDPDDGRRLAIRAVRDAAGRGHHLELDAQLVQG